MNQINQIRQRAFQMTREQFDRLTDSQVSSLATTFGQSGRVYTTKDRARVWKVIQKLKPVELVNS